MAHLFTLHQDTPEYVKMQKKTHELDITVEISTIYRPELRPDTGIHFLDHMLDTFSWGLCMSLGCEVICGKWRSTHTIAEDVAITLGAALKKLFYRKLNNEGINISGYSLFGLDESLARVMVSMEGRRNSFISYKEGVKQFEMAEDLQSADLEGFVEGFAQGFPGTVHVDFLKSRDAHHAWESAFFALGDALRMAYIANPWRISSHNPYYAEEGIADASLV
jgi:imidazoleglycerol-phosphate dehydratase